MHPADPETLAIVVGRNLRQLPMPHAPHTLLPRVIAAVQEWARRPWYARAWFTWPRGWQIGSVAALVLVGVGAVMLAPSAQAAATRVASAYGTGVAGDVVGIAERAEATRNAAWILWRALVQPFAVYAFAFVAL